MTKRLLRHYDAGVTPMRLVSAVPIMTCVPNANFVGALAVAFVTIAAAISSATDPWLDLSPRPADMIGTLSCTSASCHGSPQPRGNAGGAARQEYVHWLGGEPTYQADRRGYDPRARIEKASGDPHALAALRMQEPRFQEVLRRYIRRADGSSDPRAAAKCAKCHDPAALEHSTPHAPREESIPRSVMRTVDGIGCESCHGAARQWVAVHYQRDISREQLAQLGMVDTKNLFIRARLCSSCHVGSVENDMNHDMIAAGHPPLRFELASYEALLPRKHWDDGPRRLAEPDYEVQLWAAGRVAAAEAALALLESRAQRASEPLSSPNHAPWPEFAESNCFACHQALRPIGGEAHGDATAIRSLGVPVWQSWNVALASEASESFPGELAQLRTAMQDALIPTAHRIAPLAANARSALTKSTMVAENGAIVDHEGRLLGAASVLAIVNSSLRPLSWDEACQRLAALVAAERSLRDRGQTTEGARQRAMRIAMALCFRSPSIQWPAALPSAAHADGDVDSWTLERVQDELIQLAYELERTAKAASR